MFFLGHFFDRISSDFRQKELLPLKLLFFVHSSTLYVLYPYLTIHMRELGINVEETAIMSAVTPVVAIVMPPLAGLIADRIGNFKVILSLFSALGGAVSLLLLMVPVGRVVITYPQRTLLQLACNNGSAVMSVAEAYPCHRRHNRSMEIPVQVETCGLACLPSQHSLQSYGARWEEAVSPAVVSSRNFTVLLSASDGEAYSNLSDAYTYRLGGPGEERQDAAVAEAGEAVDIAIERRQSTKLKNAAHFATTVRRLEDGFYFFPTSGLFRFECRHDKCGPVRRDEVNAGDVGKSVVAATATEYRMLLDQKAHGHQQQTKLHLVAARSHPDSSRQNYWNSTCPYQLGGEVERVVVPLGEDVLQGGDGVESGGLVLDECQVRCLATLERRHVCTNMQRLVQYDIRLTFWFYLSIRVFIGMISGTAFAMFEGAVIAILREHKADYGLQRMYATIGGMISSPVSGWLIDYASEIYGYTDFSPAFYLYAGLKIVSAMLMLTINLEFKVPATNVLSDVVTVLKKIEIVALFLTCFILGTAWGYIESFLFWLLQDLGASRSLMGITITVGGIAGLPLLVMSGPIIDRIGHANVLFIGFIFYAIRLIGYSLIYNPWMCLIFEAMESVTSSLAFTAAVTYAAKLSTTTTDSSIQGLLGGLYFGVGKGSGSLIGGYLMKAVGTRPTYQIFAAVTLITGCLYYLFNKFYIVHHCEGSSDKAITDKKEASEKKEESTSFGNKKQQAGLEANHVTIVETDRQKPPPSGDAKDTVAQVDQPNNQLNTDQPTNKKLDSDQPINKKLADESVGRMNEAFENDDSTPSGSCTEEKR